jgi:hypothetical protein
MKSHNYLLTAQGAYYLITAIWPLVDIDSFLFVTGPKTDIWLVKTVGALLIPVSLTMLAGIRSRKTATPSVVLASTTALVFLIIDFHYSLTGVIGRVYMIDGVLQLFFLVMWSVLLTKLSLSYK